MIKRILRLAIITLFALASMCALFGCQNKPVKDTEPYGEVELAAQNNVILSPVLKDIHPDGLSLGIFPLQYPTYVRVLDAKEIENDITYVSDDPGSQENAIIVTKWVYYAILLYANREDKSEYLLRIADPDIYDRVLCDKYCMEKFHMDIYSYIFDESSSPYYGKTYREVYVENGGDLPVIENMNLLKYPVSGYMSAEDNTLYYECSYGLRIAALQRYGLLDVNKLEKTSAEIKIDSYRTSFYDDDGSETEFSSCNKILNVVGYIETEADKLLSTGVSMDKNSEEYKIVMQQLQNPVIYSVCGNFLEEVK